MFLEIGSVRLGPHSKGDDTRDKVLIEKIKKLDPIIKIKKKVSNFSEIDDICLRIIDKTFEIVNKYEDAE